MRVRRYLVAATAVFAIGVIGVLGYLVLFTQGYGQQMKNEVPWLGGGHPVASTTNGTSAPTGSKGGGTTPDSGTDTPELPSGVLVLVGLVPLGAGLVLVDRRRGRGTAR